MIDLMSSKTGTTSASHSAPSVGDPLLALTVDTLRQGLILLDAGGHLIAANAAAQRAIRQHPALDWASSPEPPHDRLRLQVRRSALQLRFERALRHCAATSPSAGAAPQVVAFPDDRGQPTLILQLSPIALPEPNRADDAAPRAAVLGVLVDRASEPVLEPAMLRELFGLTEAESRVAEAYLRADTVKEVGERLGVSVNTVKTHLAAVYQKTGCTRQAQMVRLLMALSGLGDEPVGPTERR